MDEQKALYAEIYGLTRETHDLGLAAALVTKNYEIMNITWNEEGRALFVFYDGIGMEETWECFFNGRLDVDARTYFNNVKMLKSRIYAG